MKEIRVGTVTGGHGIKGWVKVYSYTDPVESIMEYSPWILKKGRAEALEVKVLAHRTQGKKLIAQLEGVTDRNQADELKGYDILMDRANLPDLEEGEFYWHQLEGLNVVNSTGTLFGVVYHMMETGANDVLVVKATKDSVDEEERLIPYVEGSVVKEVDLDAGEIVVDWEADF